MNLQRLLQGQSLLLLDTACILVIKVISIHHSKKRLSRKMLKLRGTVNS